MDLRSGHAFWPLKNGLLETYPPLTADKSCDVVVIGAGVTGALIASRLVDDGVDVIVLDKRDVAAGSTSASTALLQYELDTEFVELAARVGEGSAARCYRLGLEAIDWIERRVARLGDSCDFVRRPSLYLASDRRDAARLKAECDARGRHGFAVEFLDADAVRARYPFPAPAAIRGDGDAEIDPFRFTHRLLADARARGVRVFDRTTVASVETGPGGFVMTTDRGPGVRAKRVVFATGYESEEYLKTKGRTLSSTFAVVSEPLDPFPHWPERCFIWESARPYVYLRSLPDGRALIGGEDVPFSSAHRSDRLVAKKTDRLVRRFEALFPGTTFEPAYAWAGTFAASDDGLPTVGRPPDRPDTYFALGYGGNGITFGVIASALIADELLGRPNPDAELFRFGRPTRAV